MFTASQKPNDLFPRVVSARNIGTKLDEMNKTATKHDRVAFPTEIKYEFEVNNEKKFAYIRTSEKHAYLEDILGALDWTSYCVKETKHFVIFENVDQYKFITPLHEAMIKPHLKKFLGTCISKEPFNHKFDSTYSNQLNPNIVYQLFSDDFSDFLCTECGKKIFTLVIWKGKPKVFDNHYDTHCLAAIAPPAQKKSAAKTKKKTKKSKKAKKTKKAKKAKKSK